MGFSTSISTPKVDNFKERKYFDSGDYALSKAGKASEGGVTTIGSQHPLPENIPHLTSPGPTSSTNGNGNGSGNGVPVPGAQSGSPVKESSFLHRSESVDEGTGPRKDNEESSASSPPKEGVPTRWQH